MGGLNLEGGIEDPTPAEAVHAELMSMLPPAADTASSGETKRERTLIVLEGCERILDQIRAALPPLLAARPGSTVLFTALKPMSTYGEETLRLGPLSLPRVEDVTDPRTAEQREAVNLFVRRAKVARPDFELTAENRDAVLHLCQHTGGLPLAIEFIAERMKLKTPQSVAREIEMGLSAYRGNQRGTLSRHRGMREALAWAVGFARPEERFLLERISVFDQGVDQSTVAAVCSLSTAEAEEQLARLLDINLLRTQDGDHHLFFHLDPLTKIYLREQLCERGELDEARMAHADYLLQTVEALRKSMASGDGRHQPSLIHLWSADLRAAMEFFQERGNRGQALTLAIVLGRHAFNGTHAAAAVLRKNIDSRELPASLAVETEVSSGRLAIMRGENHEAYRLLTRARERQEIGDLQPSAVTLRLLGSLALGRGETAEAECLLRRAKAELTNRGDEYELLETLRDLTRCLLVQGTHETAKNTAREALAVAERSGCTVSWALAESVLSSVLLTNRGAEGETAHRLRSAVKDLFHQGFEPELLPALERLAEHLVAHSEGDLARVDRAVVIASATSAHRKVLVTAEGSPSNSSLEEVLDRARDLLGPKRFIDCWSTGQYLDLRGTVARAITPSDDGADTVTIPAQSPQRPPPGPDRPPSPHPENPLTAREMQVAELASRGETNLAIATRLGISKWTAVNHMRKIMRKLELSSRTEVAIWFNRARTST
ncbi:hypothetical protein GCM10007147_07210 [Nocardiopsis kunsanensis]|uniref:HTH luxR-type domain-containing protein n=1 Tax=Nocardiopsis kunsanensis TaxID=141693 RepID=A0A919CG72_9ACTN|nr:LuxR C-terminal-related transcriptional regulator [Nocardiopsis kunsanensis]GHD17738.1 hypothetical protein GCM10007147_07210 [Nocardiopsis kunsanensis]